MNEQDNIPIFPLNVVLYPESKIPLHIFEERYKKMVNDCMYNGQIFGINLYYSDKIQDVGCTAIVDRVINRYPGGELDIIVKGVERYSLKEYHVSGIGYYVSDIEYLSGDNFDYPKEKMDEAIKLYNEMIDVIYRGSLDNIEISDAKWAKRSLCYFMAEKSGLSLIERQKLLEMNTESERLDYVLTYLKDVLPEVIKAGRISDIIKSDGYLQE